VLLDMMMPIMGGPAMLAAMVAHPELAGIPLIYSQLPARRNNSGSHTWRRRDHT
jgi:CheY-like chemotaxis protein